MAFKPRETNIEEIFSRRKKYIIPRYQRKYIWNEEQWLELYEDIFSFSNEEGHFLGSFVLEDDDTTFNMSVIDGQQRITTIIVIFSVFMRVFFELDEKPLIEDTEGFLKGLDGKGSKFIKLYNDEIDAVEYIVNINDGIPGNIKNLKKDLNSLGMKLTKHNQTVCDSFMFYYNKIKKQVESLTPQKKVEQLIVMRDQFVRTKVLEIVVSEEREGYNIFEILNARGVDLEQHELLKNYVLNYFRPIDDLDIAKKQWIEINDNLISGNNDYLNIFLSHYTTHKYEKPRKGNKEFRIIRSNVSKSDVRKLLMDLVVKSKFYKYIIEPISYLEEESHFSEVYDSLLYFKNMNIRQVRPLLLSLFGLKERDEIDSITFIKLVKHLENFYFQYISVMRNGTNTIEKFIYNYSSKFESDFNNDLIQEFIDKSYNYLPSKELFISNFDNLGYSNKNKNFKNTSNKKLINYILSSFENHFNTTQETRILNFTVEHIKSDSETDDCSRMIGNLLPLAQKINEKAGNKDFTEKIQLYKRSNFELVKHFITRYENNLWDDSSIKIRTKKFAELAYNTLWKCKNES